jgi:uncharacterized protein
VLQRELQTLTWSALKARLWLHHPLDPATQQVKKRVYWLAIPIMLYGGLVEGTGVLHFLTEGFLRLFPDLTPPDYMQMQTLATPQFRGAWYLLGFVLVSGLFNYLLGEELFFRGILLPKMEGVFGHWAWVANGILFAAYHVHKIETIPVLLVGSVFIAYLNQRYRSFYPALIIHGVEFIYTFVLVTLFVAGVISL